jgi:hypothetical protein
VEERRAGEGDRAGAGRGAAVSQACLALYSIFHLNLAYSSIPEEKRKEVIDRCFWPLLRLATDRGIPLAIEAPAYTLGVARKLDPDWIEALRKAVTIGEVEFVGAGYAQLIGPLVPAMVNRWNLEIGREKYRELLGAEPALWYVNEQAYSRGMVEHYVKVGASAILMEWNNPRTLHPEWCDTYRYHPQAAVGTNGFQIPVIWNDSVSFQKLQRCAHGEITIEELIDYLRLHVGGEDRFLCLYGNDAEIFDFRPGRFGTEPCLSQSSEWERLSEIYQRLREDTLFRLVAPRTLLDGTRPGPESCLPLALESAAQPIPVKKQPKYNVTRWAITGRDSLRLNTACYEMLTHLENMRGPIPNELKADLCQVWSSDFRTHITAGRWETLQEQLDGLRKRVGRADSHPAAGKCSTSIRVNGFKGELYRPACISEESLCGTVGPEVSQEGRFIRVRTPSVDIHLSPGKGLSIERLIFPSVSLSPLAGTIPHGYFEDIGLSADWYTGSTVLQRPGNPQITDLLPTEVALFSNSGNGTESITCQSSVMTAIGPILKKVRIYRGIPQVDLDFTFSWKVLPIGAFRTAFVTLIPSSFDRESLFYATHNGGSQLETFPIAGSHVAHGAPGSSVVSASSGLGATEGLLILGDARKALAVWFDQTVCAAMPMLTYREAPPSFFARLMFSCGEMDESRVAEVPGPLRFCCSLSGLRVEE